MPRASLLGIITAAAVLIASFFLLSGQIFDLYSSIYKTTPMGEALATIHAIFFHDFSKLPVFTWLVAGFIIGLVMRSSKRGFIVPFYASLFMLVVFYPASLAAGLVQLPHTLEGEFILIKNFMFPFVANWIIGGIGGLIGGRVARLLPKKAPSELEEKAILEEIPVTCPHCGNVVYSKSVWCANCGKKLE